MPLLAALAVLQAAAGELPPLAAPATPIPPTAEATTCSGPLYARFDFLLGDWNVFARDGGVQVARSRVAKINANCAVREEWQPIQGKAGGTLNAPDLITGLWHQYWVDSTGARVDLEGGPYQGRMILSGLWRGFNGSGRDAVLRLTYTRLDADSVRQLGEFSLDEGLTWEVSFDHLYLRATRAD